MAQKLLRDALEWSFFDGEQPVGVEGVFHIVSREGLSLDTIMALPTPIPYLPAPALAVSSAACLSPSLPCLLI